MRSSRAACDHDILRDASPAQSHSHSELTFEPTTILNF